MMETSPRDPAAAAPYGEDRLGALRAVGTPANAAIEELIEGRARDLGEGFSVRRVLPAGTRRMVGPFIFFDHMGPKDFAPGLAINVRPHPHVALATVTYLYRGEILHRDSLGYAQEIHPGDVNWMTAGRGIVHSERTTPRSLERGVSLHGIQSWVALPDGHEDDAPAFHHHPAATLPQLETPDGARLRIIAGEAFGRRSPVAIVWPTLYVDVALPAGASLEIPAEHEERAVYVAEGELEIEAPSDGLGAVQAHVAAVHSALRGGVEAGSSGSLDPTLIGVGTLAVLVPGTTPRLRATHREARVMLLGGARFPSPRLIWWNYVASSEERLEAAKRDWKQRKLDRFPNVPGDEREFIPLPEDSKR